MKTHSFNVLLMASGVMKVAVGKGKGGYLIDGQHSKLLRQLNLFALKSSSRHSPGNWIKMIAG